MADLPIKFADLPIKFADLPVNFSYGKMYCFYRAFGEITDDVFVRLYHADNTAMKFERNKGRPGQLRPFTQRSMQVRKIPADDTLSDTEYGTFLVSRAPRDRVTGTPQAPDKSQRLFVVMPTECQNELYGTFWVGDHFTFQYNSGSKEDKQLQLHWTYYTPDKTNDTLGSAQTIPSHLPMKFLLQKVGFDRIIDPLLHKRAPFLHNLMHRPFAEQRAVFMPRGGGKRRQRGGASDAFDDLWYSLPIRSMIVVGVRVGRTYNVTVYVRDKAKSLLNRVLMLKCLERDVEEEIAKGFADMNADNFSFLELSDDIFDM